MAALLPPDSSYTTSRDFTPKKPDPLPSHPDHGCGAHQEDRRQLPSHLVALRQLRHPGELPTGEATKTVKLTEILDYYDGIQLFAARDPIGGHYVCDMIDTAGDFDRYVVVGVRPERLDEFRA